jgi:hypothetical protein
MILHYTDTEYEDTVWEVTKREVWMDAKSRNDVSLDFPNLPYWIDGNVKLTQSSAILRHLARKNGLYGLTDANADEIGMYKFKNLNFRWTTPLKKWFHPIAKVESFYSVKYGSSIIPSNVCQIISVMKTKTLVFPEK